MENQTSFDLNGAIQRWRRELAKSKSFGVDDLEELESHLHDSQSSLEALGLTAEEAFIIAVRRTGSGDALAAEFASINEPSIASGRLLSMTMAGITISAWWSLTSTLLLVATAVASPVVYALALLLLLQSTTVREFLKAPLKSASACLLMSLFSELIHILLIDIRFRGASPSWLHGTHLLYNVLFSIQFAASIGVMAFFLLKRRTRSLNPKAL